MQISNANSAAAPDLAQVFATAVTLEAKLRSLQEENERLRATSVANSNNVSGTTSLSASTASGAAAESPAVATSVPPLYVTEIPIPILDLDC